MVSKNVVAKGRVWAAVVASVLVIGSVGAARGEAIKAFEISGGNVVGLPFSLRWDFSVSRDIYVTDLGVFDIKGDGQADGQRVRIYNKDANTIVTTAAVSSSASPEPSGGYNAYYQAIAPLKLSPGTIYTIAAENVQPDDFAYAVTVTKAADINWIQGVATGVGTPALPDDRATGFPIVRDSDYCYFGANFKYAVPEPSSLALLVAAGLAVFACRRRFA